MLHPVQHTNKAIQRQFLPAPVRMITLQENLAHRTRLKTLLSQFLLVQNSCLIIAANGDDSFWCCPIEKKSLCSQWESCAAKTCGLQSAGPEPLWHNLSKFSLGWFCSTLHKVRLWPKSSFVVAGDADHSSVLLGHNELLHEFPKF